MTIKPDERVATSTNRVGALLVSADSHVVEPKDLWETRMPSALRDQIPPLSARPGDQPGATDPADRPGIMTTDGVSMEVLYPTHGLRQFAIEDVELQQACFRVYNDWIVEYCEGMPDRLVGVPMISAYDIDYAIAELERCAAMGLKGGLLWHVPPEHLPYSSDHYERLWATAAEMEMPINLHILSGFSYSKAGSVQGIDKYRGTVELKLQDAIHVLFDFIFHGVLERHPKLKLVLVEFEIGWIPWVLQQWDFYVKRFSSNNPVGISLLPSEFFDRQVYATFVNDEVGARNFASGWGINNCMWSNDFPHGNTSWPHSREVISRDLGHLDDKARSRLLYKNVKELYGLEIPQLIGTNNSQ